MVENINFRKKICLLGDPAVGKTSLIRQYVYHHFSDVYISTIGTEITKKEISLDYQSNDGELNRYGISFTIWDIIGQIEYRSLITRSISSIQRTWLGAVKVVVMIAISPSLPISGTRDSTRASPNSS